MPILQVKRMLFSQLSTLQAIGYTICIEAPKQTLIFCFSVQKQILFFPFRCTKMAFDLAAYLLKCTRGQASEKPPNIAELITGTKNPTMKDVQIATQGLQKSAVNAINECSKTSKIEKYKEELEKWSSEVDKKIEDCFTVNVEDKEVIKSLAINIKNLRALQAKKLQFNSAFCQSLQRIASSDYASSEDLKSLRDNFKNMNSAGSKIKETKDYCRAVLSTSNKLNTLLSNSLQQYEFTQPQNSAGQNEVPHKMQYLVSRVRQDNVTLNNTLATTNEKLEEILSVTESISKTVQDIYGQFMEVPKLHQELCAVKAKLKQEQRLLKVLEAERNTMQDKFSMLEDIIQDEQDFLDSLDSSRDLTEKLPAICEGMSFKEYQLKLTDIREGTSLKKDEAYQ